MQRSSDIAYPADAPDAPGTGSGAAAAPGGGRAAAPSADRPAVVCHGVGKRFYHYEHRTTSLRELFVRTVLRRAITVRRPHFRIRDFDLTVACGDSVALVGPNGSGKSTVLRLIAGIYPPTTGTIATYGKVGAVIELTAGFHPELTGSENIGLYATLMGLTGRELEERFDSIASFAGIEPFLDVPMKYYSSGMKMRLGFSVAISVEPEILLLDEVLAVGDQEFRERCLGRLRSFKDRGGTMIVVSHDLETVRTLCARAIWLDAGRIRMDGTIDEVLDAYRASAESADLVEAGVEEAP